MKVHQRRVKAVVAEMLERQRLASKKACMHVISALCCDARIFYLFNRINVSILSSSDHISFRASCFLLQPQQLHLAKKFDKLSFFTQPTLPKVK